MISIHALREEGDQGCGDPATPAGGFLSTPSARRATPSSRSSRADGSNFYPRPPRGGRRSGLLERPPWKEFLSTPSARRATQPAPTAGLSERNFYPRPPRGGRPSVRARFLGKNGYFYPRPPRGGRQQKQRENTLLLSHYTPPCTNCKEASVKQAVKLHRYLHSRLLFQCEASRKTMCTVCSHWPDIKRSARCPVQTPGVVQRVRPWSGSCCPVGRTADCLRRGRSGRSAPP